MSPRNPALLGLLQTGRQATDRDVRGLRDFAARWITRHLFVPHDKPEGQQLLK